MTKRISIILLFTLALSCVGEEKLVEKKGDNGKDPKPVELIYNEPLLLYYASLESVKTQEARLFISGSADRLTYFDNKNSYTYQISYYFERDQMTGASVIFDYDQATLDLLYEGLSYKYEVISEDPMIFNNKEYARQISIEYDISSNYISVDY